MTEQQLTIEDCQTLWGRQQLTIDDFKKLDAELVAALEIYFSEHPEIWIMLVPA